MPNREASAPKFAVGSRVRLRKGALAVCDTEAPVDGWLGTVSQVSGTTYLIHWNNAALDAASRAHRERGKRESNDLRVMWLQEKTLEAVPANH